MRGKQLLIAGCIVAMSQIGLATPQEILTVKVSKPDTTHDQFVADRDACLTEANNDRLGGSTPTAWAKHHLKLFSECMVARGYKSDPDGFRAIRYIQTERGRRIIAEAL